jgi:hypothetical protein
MSRLCYPQEAIKHATELGMARFNGVCSIEYNMITGNMAPELPHFHLPPITDTCSRVRLLLTFHLNTHYRNEDQKKDLDALFLGPAAPKPAVSPLYPTTKFAGLKASWEALKKFEPSDVEVRSQAGTLNTFLFTVNN